MENLRALVYGKKLTDYQRRLAQKEFERLETSLKDVNRFIANIEELLKVDTNSSRFDDIQFSIDNFKMVIKAIINEY